jgi:hypothetical protein
VVEQWLGARRARGCTVRAPLSPTQEESMVKLVFIAYRKPGLTHEQYNEHLRSHAELVMTVKDVTRMRKYVQVHPLQGDINKEFLASRGMTLDDMPDGMAEVWWDSAEDMYAGFSGEEGAKAAQLLIDDEARFLDVDRCVAFLAEDKVIFDFGHEQAAADASWA